MKFNVAVLAVLAATLAGAPLIAAAADTGSTDASAAAAPAKAKHSAKHHAAKKAKKSAPSTDSAPK